MRVSNELAFAVVKDSDDRYLALGMGRNSDTGVATYQKVGFLSEANNRDVSILPRYDSNRALALAGEQELTET